MKKATYFIVYTATLVIGVLLLIFSQEPMTRTDPVSLRTVVIASGIVYIAIGIISFLFSLRKKETPEGVIKTRPWYLTAMSIAAIFWGILIIVMSRPMTTTLAVTLGISLIIASFAQVIWIAGTTHTSGVSGWWYIIPFCVLGAGIIDITLVNDYANAGKSSSVACILSGILLLCYSLNGFISLKNLKRRHEKEKARLLKETTSGKLSGSEA
jgi:uncharacterized membrane protein HdeD (DUF308 family)